MTCNPILAAQFSRLLKRHTVHRRRGRKVARKRHLAPQKLTQPCPLPLRAINANMFVKYLFSSLIHTINGDEF